MTSRRRVLGMLCAAGVAGSVSAVRAAAAMPLQAWLERQAKSICSIDARDEDFTDLAPLATAIKSARVVQLGEPSHGAGSAFAAKARLVKFLHQQMGFDVLVWESGLYDVALAEAAMRSAQSGVDAARNGIFKLWTEAAQVGPLFDYIKASQSTLQPLEMAGFDLQVTAGGTRESFAADLRAFGSGLTTDVRSSALNWIEDALAARDRLYATKFGGADDLTMLTAAVRKLRALIAAKRVAFDAAHGSLDADFMDRAIENMGADAALRFEAARGPTDTARESRRDGLNAANLRWLLEKRYPGRKAIVWAHNVHVMNAYYAPGFHAVHRVGRRVDMKTTGVFVKNWLGDAVYTIGCTAYQGREGLAVGGPATAIAVAPDGSVEARLHSLGYPHAFVDFRASRNDPGSPFHQGQAIRIPKFETNVIVGADRIYDGLLFIDQMSAATPV